MYISAVYIGYGIGMHSRALRILRRKSVTTLGWFQYRIARKLAPAGYGFAFSQDDFAFYIIFERQWLR